MCVLKESKKALNKAAKILLNGKIVCAMTETVYGLLGNAEDPKAIQKIYKIKQRPIKNPLIVHVNSIAMAKKIAVFTGDASKLASKFWPGPLTLILKKKKSNVCPNVTANLRTIAIRFPDSKIFFDIITKIKKPIAAPSANRSGFVSATRTSHVKQYFKHKIDLIIDSGQSKFGLESTVINLSSSPYRILRPGVIQKATIQKILNKRVYDHDLSNKIIISPGQFTKHYSTYTPIRMNAKKQLKGEAFLSFGKNKSIRHDNLNLSTKGNLEEAAHNLFDYLIQLDKLNKTTIAVSPIPDEGLGKVINDKLKRACRYG